MNTETHAIRGWLPFSGIAGGSAMEGIGAISTVILAILVLAGILTNLLISIATIVIGAVILMEGEMTSFAYHRLAAHTAGEGQMVGSGGGVAAEFFGGLAGIVLGILSFFHPAETLIAVAVLALGAALVLGGGARFFGPLQQGAGMGVSAIAASGLMFIGLAAVVLGILAIVGIVPTILVPVGLLSLGAGALFGGHGTRL